MKNLTHIFLALLLFFGYTLSGQDQSPGKPPASNADIQVVSSEELQPLVREWTNGYKMEDPSVTIESTVFVASELPENVIKPGQVGFISENGLKSCKLENSWHIVVGREVIVPVINSANPGADQISATGISPAKLANVFSKSPDVQWADLLDSGGDSDLRLLLPNDAAVISAVKSYLDLKEISHGVELVNSGELITRLQNDPYSLAFCRLTDVTDREVLEMNGQIRLLPIDKNGNGELDYYENIYTNVNDFIRGVWIGKYPHELVNNIYAISTMQPGENEDIAFLKWILTSGQLHLASNGYNDLTFRERQSSMSRINENTELPVATTTTGNAGLKTIVIAMLVLIVLGILVEGIFILRKYRKPILSPENEPYEGVFTERALRIPGGLFYDKSHTWAYMETDGRVRIGVNDFLVHLTGQVTGIRMKVPGDKVKKGEVILSLVQEGKQLNIKAPVSGVIMQSNKNLQSHASLVNASPYNDGWVYMIEPTNWVREIQLLLMAENFRNWIDGEFARVKDFLAGLQKTGEARLAGIVLQEGGEIVDGVLADLGPEEWEDFQTKFIEKTL